MINLNAAGVDDGSFTASVSELKNLYLKRAEMATVYTPQSEPMREINRLINEAKSTSFGQLRKYYEVYNVQLGTINGKISNLESELSSLPFKQKKIETKNYQLPDYSINKNVDFSNKINPSVVNVSGLQEQNDGNNVNLDSQMSELSKNKVIFDAIQSSIKRDSKLFRSVVESSAKN